MKNIRLEPLLIIIIPIILLVFFFTLEKKVSWGEETVSVGELESDSSDGGGSKEAKEEKEIPEGYTKMTLVIGQMGSMEDTETKVPIFKEPDPNCAELAGRLEYNCAVVAKEGQSTSYSADWICVELPGTEEEEGYIRRDAQIKIAEVTFGSEDTFYNGVIQDAISYIGRKFVAGGDSLTEGIDCSHFAAQMYKMNGVKIPKTPLKQKKKGTVVATSDDSGAKVPGSIIFYDRANDGGGHVGIYLGDGGVNNPEEYTGGFIINSTGHTGKTYPEGGVRIVCLLYPDRDHYEELSFLTEEGVENE